MVATFPSFAGKRQVSINGGVHPTWRRDGSELLFQAPDAKVMSVEIRVSGPNIESGRPTPLFPMPHLHNAGSGSFRYWPSSDGRRFLVLERNQAPEAQTVVVLNWASGCSSSVEILEKNSTVAHYPYRA